MTTLRTTLALIVALAVAWPTPAAVQTLPNTLTLPKGEVSPKASLADLSWLIGHWTGTGLGGVSEEVWAGPAGGAMMGMYRLVVNGKVQFYELMNLVEENGSLVLRLKHFNADFTAWEEKDRFVSFPLVKLGKNEAWFSGLTFRRVDENQLQIFLSMRGSDGTVREERFELTRQVR